MAMVSNVLQKQTFATYANVMSAIQGRTMERVIKMTVSIFYFTQGEEQEQEQEHVTQYEWGRKLRKFVATKYFDKFHLLKLDCPFCIPDTFLLVAHYLCNYGSFFLIHESGGQTRNKLLFAVSVFAVSYIFL